MKWGRRNIAEKRYYLGSKTGGHFLNYFYVPPIAVETGKTYISKLNKYTDIYKKPFFACAICVIYTAVSLGIALFGF